VNDENKIGYYAVIPATVLFNEQLKANVKLLYAIITVLSNKEGYCFASNSYLANLLNVKSHTISKWVSELKALGFVHIEIIKNEKGEIVQRRIYPNDTPYAINRTYPYSINRTEGMSQKGQYNIISNNMIDRFFKFILNKEEKIPNEFIDIDKKDIFNILEKFDMLYTVETTTYLSEENLEMIKSITYALGLIAKYNIKQSINNINRDKLIKIYQDCKTKEYEYKDTEYEIENFMNYYYKSLVNEITKGKSPSFFRYNNSKYSEEGENIELWDMLDLIL